MNEGREPRAPERTEPSTRSPATEESREDWATRRASLEARLASHQARRGAEEERSGPSGSGMQGIAEGLKLASEFAAGIIVGGALGYAFDYFAGTSPFGLIVLLLFGFAAGTRNVLRAVGPKSSSQSPPGGETIEASDDKKNSQEKPREPRQ